MNFNTYLDINVLGNMFLLLTLIILYIGLFSIGWCFKNKIFVSFAFFIGIFIGLLLSGIHLFFTFTFLFMNISLYWYSIKN